MTVAALAVAVVALGLLAGGVPALDISQSNDVLDPVSGFPADELGERLSFWQWFLSHVGSWFGSETDEPEPVLVPPEKCEPCTCGLINKRTRIVGGQETQVNQYPWMVRLFYNGQFYCGGSLINSLYVLTASHCLHGFDHHQITIRLMEHDVNTDSEAQHIDRRVKWVVKHSRYSQSNFNNDIALIRLNEEVELAGLLRPVCLPTLGKNFTGELGIVTGWGTIKQGGMVSPVLREVTVPIISNDKCRKSGYGSYRITDNMICAGYPEGKRDSCQGDSGGPLHVANSTIHCIAGVVSWGDGCARPNYPGVYARVNRYLTWIGKHTIDACPCQPQYP